MSTEMANSGFFGTKTHVTPKSICPFCRDTCTNSSELLCLFCISVCFMKTYDDNPIPGYLQVHKDLIYTKKALLRRRTNTGFWHPRERSASEAKGQNLPEFKLVYDFMSLLVSAISRERLCSGQGHSWVSSCGSSWPVLFGFSFDIKEQVHVTRRWKLRSSGSPNSFEIECLPWLAASTTLSSGQHCPHFKSVGAFGCNSYHSYYSICPKPYAAFPWC